MKTTRRIAREHFKIYSAVLKLVSLRNHNLTIALGGEKSRLKLHEKMFYLFFIGVIFLSPKSYR